MHVLLPPVPGSPLSCWAEEVRERDQSLQKTLKMEAKGIIHCATLSKGKGAAQSIISWYSSLDSLNVIHQILEIKHLYGTLLWKEAPGAFETVAGKSVQHGKNAIISLVLFLAFFPPLLLAILAFSMSFCPEVNTQGEFTSCSPNCDQIFLVVPNEADRISLVTLFYLRGQKSLQ